MKRDIICLFLGKDKIIAASVNKRKEYRQIGFQGEIEYLYRSTTDIDDCVTCLESTYNVDTLSELDVAFYIVDCGANLSLKNYLLQKIEDCRRVSSLFVDDLLYVITGKMKLIHPGCKIGLDFLDKNAYVCDEAYQWIRDENESTSEVIMLEDLLKIFIFDVNDLQYDDTEYNQKIVKERKILEDKIKSLSEQLEKSLTINNDYRQKEIRKEKEIASILNRRKFIALDYKLTAGKFIIKKENGSIISQGETIAWMIKKNHHKQQVHSFIFNNTNNVHKEKILADSSGKIAWLFPTEKYIRNLILNHNEYKKGKIPVAIIGDTNDKVEDMIDWGRKQSGLNFK